MPGDKVDRDEYVATAVHELRGPLSIVSVYAERLNEPGLPDAERVEAGELIQRNVKRIAAIVDGLLELDRHRPDGLGERREAGVAALVERVAAAARTAYPGRGIAVTVRPGAGVRIMVDEDAIERALGNLLTNALAYSGDDVTVEIDAADDGCTIAVADLGIGIPPEGLGRLFERFARVPRPPGAHGARGAGLGLAIAKAIIERHGGTIEAVSAPGRGTTMTVRLPAGS